MRILARIILGVAIMFACSDISCAQNTSPRPEKNKLQNVNTGVVYIFWLGSESSILPREMVRAFDVGVDGKKIGPIQPGEFITENLSAGTHTVTLEEPLLFSSAKITSNVMAGAKPRYYEVVSRQYGGGWLEEASAEVATPEIAKLRHR